MCPQSKYMELSPDDLGGGFEVVSRVVLRGGLRGGFEGGFGRWFEGWFEPPFNSGFVVFIKTALKWHFMLQARWNSPS